jgi:hypothetical protein
MLLQQMDSIKQAILDLLAQSAHSIETDVDDDHPDRAQYIIQCLLNPCVFIVPWMMILQYVLVKVLEAQDRIMLMIGHFTGLKYILICTVFYFLFLFNLKRVPTQVHGIK